MQIVCLWNASPRHICRLTWAESAKEDRNNLVNMTIAFFGVFLPSS